MGWEGYLESKWTPTQSRISPSVQRIIRFPRHTPEQALQSEMLDKVRALSKIKPRLDKAGVEVIQVYFTQSVIVNN